MQFYRFGTVNSNKNFVKCKPRPSPDSGEITVILVKGSQISYIISNFCEIHQSSVHVTPQLSWHYQDRDDKVCFPQLCTENMWEKIWFLYHWISKLRAPLTHWSRVTHICVSKQAIIGSDHGLSPGPRQAIIWTNAGIFLIGPLGTNFSESLIEISIFSFTKMHLKMSSGKWRQFCLGLNVLNFLATSLTHHSTNPIKTFTHCHSVAWILLLARQNWPASQCPFHKLSISL